MPSTRNSALLAVSILSLSSVLATPLSIRRSVSLARRYVESINDCDEDQTKKLNQDFADAASFALHALTDINEDHTAFGHYFRTGDNDGMREDLQQAQSMWSAIASNNDPTNPSYTFTVRCAAENDDECANRKTQSFAITDAQPQDGDTPRQMKICPLYFTHDWTKQSTTSHPYKPNPKRTEDSWCKPEAKFRAFSVGGLTLLHEMTHLDAVAASADYPDVHDDEGDFDTHATEDVAGVNPEDNPPLQARNLAQIWQRGEQDDYDELTQPFRNAESLAAAALENYVMKFCELDNIDI